MQNTKVNQATQQSKVKFMPGDKVKYKKGFASSFHDPEDTYTVEEFQSGTRIALVESNYVAYPDDLELVSRPIKHKHYDLIVEWAKDPVNVIVQYNGLHGWTDTYHNHPGWCKTTEYRIKPKTEQVTRWKWVFLAGTGTMMESTAYYTEEEAKKQFQNATPYKLESTAITAIEEV